MTTPAGARHSRLRPADLTARAPRPVLPRHFDPTDEPSRVLAEVSHDLRTPLASLRLLVEGLRDGVLPDEDRADYLAQMQTQVSLLTDMVEGLHALSRVRAGASPLREAVDLTEVIDRVLAALRVQAETRGVVLQRDVAGTLPVICASALQLQRALANLIENAIRHTDSGGIVSVHAHATLGRIELEVRDDGDGIPAQERGRVFRAFYVPDAEHSPARSGLGLAIVHAAVEEHGGRIWLDDSSRGTRVRISLPANPPRNRSRPHGHAFSASSNDSLSMGPRRLESAAGG